MKSAGETSGVEGLVRKQGGSKAARMAAFCIKAAGHRLQFSPQPFGYFAFAFLFVGTFLAGSATFRPSPDAFASADRCAA